MHCLPYFLFLFINISVSVYVFMSYNRFKAIAFFKKAGLFRRNLLDKVSDIVDNDITQLPDDHLCHLLLFGSNAYNERANEMILKCTVEFVKQTKRFQ